MPAKAKQGNKKYTLGNKGGEYGEFDLVCPSGADCRAKRPGVQGLIKMGLLDSMDSLTALVQTDHFDRVDAAAGKARTQAEQVKDLSGKMPALTAGLELVDRLVCGVVLQPRLLPVPPEGEPREPDEIYIDMVDLDDRIFIMNWAVGGTADVAQFRQERNELMGNVPGE